MESCSLTNNIVGEVITESINNMQENDKTGDASTINNLDEYPMDPHDLSCYGDSPLVRELGNGNYLVYRDSYLLISQEDRANFAITYSRSGWYL